MVARVSHNPRQMHADQQAAGCFRQTPYVPNGLALRLASIAKGKKEKASHVAPQVKFLYQLRPSQGKHIWRALHAW